jgi:hypothetical protein
MLVIPIKDLNWTLKQQKPHHILGNNIEEYYEISSSWFKLPCDSCLMWIILYLQIHILEYCLFCVELHFASLEKYENMEYLLATINNTARHLYIQT